MREITTEKTILNERSDTLKKFFKDIDSYPIYSGEEQIELARKAKNGDLISREKLIKSNLRFVVTCAKKYTSQNIPLMDLISAGITGLILSLDNFDPNRGIKFLSFAVWYIRREILKEIYNTGRTIRYPITYISNITKVKKSHDDFLTKNQREPTSEELFKCSNISKKQYDSVNLNKSYCQSFDTPISEDGATTIEDTIAEEVAPLSDQFTKDSISEALKCLNDREYKVITEFYGVDGQYERPVKEIAQEMGLGDERVRQIRKAAIKKLNHRKGKTLKTLL